MTNSAPKSSPRSRQRKRRTPTRTLLACAVIGAAGGLIVAPVSVFSSSGPALALPLLYAALAMIKLLPGILAQTLLRTPGVALLTGIIVGLINIPLSAHGPLVFVSLAGIGLLQEVVPAVLLYRRWNLGMLIISNLMVGAVLAFLGWRVLATDATHPALAAGYWVTAAVVAVALTIAGFAIGARVRRSGVVGTTDPAAAPA